MKKVHHCGFLSCQSAIMALHSTASMMQCVSATIGNHHTHRVTVSVMVHATLTMYSPVQLELSDFVTNLLTKVCFNVIVTTQHSLMHRLSIPMLPCNVNNNYHQPTTSINAKNNSSLHEHLRDDQCRARLLHSIQGRWRNCLCDCTRDLLLFCP